MRLLTGARLRGAIIEVSSGQNVSCAVAFWGAEAVNLIGETKHRNIRLICNLAMGGTNPDAIAALIASRAIVQQIDRLHAKVYIGDQWAIVASANASINGLGLQGDELAGWIEAGVKVPAKEALPWFEAIWAQSRPISNRDINEARAKFRARAIMTPTRASFAEFSPTAADFPLVEWVCNADYDYHDDEIKKGIGYVSSTVHKQIDEGFDVESEEDIQFFSRGRWALRWSPRADGLRNRRSNLWWTCSSGTYVPNAFSYKGEQPLGAVLAMDSIPPMPFNPNDPNFRSAFDEIMSRKEFRLLRYQEYEGSWYTPTRVKKIWEFWEALRENATSP